MGKPPARGSKWVAREESSELFAALAEHSLAGIYLSQDGVFQYVNPRLCQICGFSARELVGRLGPECIVDPEDWPLVQENIRKRIQGEIDSISCEFRCRKKNGEPFDAAVYGSRVVYSGKPAVIGTLLDVTERRRSEEKIARLSRIYSVLSEVNQAVVRVRSRDELFEEVCRVAVEKGLLRMAWVGLVDEKSRLVKPVAHWGLNEGYLDKLKISVSDVARGRGPTGTAIRQGKHFVCNDIADDKRMLPWRKEALKRGYRSCGAFPLRRGRQVVGSVNLYADEPGFFDRQEVHLFDEAATDISFALQFLEYEKQRSQAETALRESEERYRRLVEVSPDAIAVYLEGVVAFANPAGVRLVGAKSADELLGRPVLEFVHPDSRPAVIERMRQMAKTARPVPIIEEKFLRVDGSTVDVEVAATPTTWHGKPAVQVVIRDITQRKQAEAQLRAALGELDNERARMEKLAARTIEAQERERQYLAAEIHDDLLQGLVATSYWLDMIDPPGLDEKTRERKDQLKEVVSSAVVRGRALINEIRPVREPEIGLADAVAKSIEVNLGDMDVKAGFRRPKSLPEMSLHVETNILRIIQEALLNVRKHSRATRVLVRISLRKGRLEFEVTDDGVGFDCDAVMESTVGHYGLVTMEGRAYLIGGELTVTSRPGEGTSVKGSFSLD